MSQPPQLLLMEQCTSQAWDGCQYAVKKDTGELIWKQNLTSLTAGLPELANFTLFVGYLKSFLIANRVLHPGTVTNLADLLSRSTPTVAGNLLVFGLYNPCLLLALNRFTGALVWSMQLDPHPCCIFTQSGTYFQGSILIGTSSTEESAPNCCTFQGAFFEIDAKTGRTVWKVRMLPDNHNQTRLYAGAAIWGSSPAIDIERRLVYIATGNLYSEPPEVEACVLARLNQSNPPIPEPCLTEDDHQESVVAIEIDTGKISWSRRLGGYDVWTMICQDSPVPLPNCPKVLGPDFDFGEAPFLLSIKEAAGDLEYRDIVVVGQKSGIVHALDRVTGEVVWQSVAGPGGFNGGSMWGMTTDGERVFTNIANSDGKNFTLVPSSTVITWGGWVGINGSTGSIIWSTANPDPYQPYAPLTYANGVFFGASEGSLRTGNPPGKIIALDAETGAILWSYPTQGGVAGGLSISDGCVFQPVGGPLKFITAPANSTIHGNSTISLCVP